MDVHRLGANEPIVVNVALFCILLCVALPSAARAQTVATPVLSSAAALTVAEGARAEALRNGWELAIAVVDPAGELIHFTRMDGVQHGSIELALGKARAAARFRRASASLEELVTSGRLGFLSLDGIVPLRGGLPIVLDGRVVGAVGVSGATSAEDEQAALAGTTALVASSAGR